MLGTGQVNKSDEFSEKFQTAFDPAPLIFGKLHCAFRDCRQQYIYQSSCLLFNLFNLLRP